jgi:hypothetical protein
MSPDFDVGERLKEAKERGVGVDMPVPLHERLNELSDLVYDAGYERPSKKKMLASIVLAAPADAEELDRLLRAYDRARVSDALVTSKPEGAVVEFPHRRSGPRPR